MPKLKKAKSLAMRNLRTKNILFENNLRKRTRNFDKNRQSSASNAVECKNLTKAISLANNQCRSRVAEYLIDALLRMYQEQNKFSDYRVFLATFCWDQGIIDADDPNGPDISKFVKKIRNTLHRNGLSGIGAVQIDVLRKEKRYQKNRHLLHIHCICWTKDNSFQPKVLGRRLSSSSAFPNQLGAPSVTFVSRKESAAAWKRKHKTRVPQHFKNLKKDQNAASLAWLVCYLLAPPVYAKNLVIKEGGIQYLRSSMSNYTVEMAVQVVSRMAAISIFDAVFAVGEGKYVRREAFKHFRAKQSKGFKKRRCGPCRGVTKPCWHKIQP